MRTMLLSFKADVYKRVLSGEKIFEYRKVFPNEDIKAFLYVSFPIKAVTGIMYLKNRTSLLEWKDRYKGYPEVCKRIDAYLPHYRYVMEIERFHETNAISLEKLRGDIPKFVVPQMYYFIDDSPLLTYLEQSLIPSGKIVKNSHKNVTNDIICP